jgi:hypothetical protein
MGFLDKVKSATGLGLTSDESYHRAYEKGVLLGKYAEASELFGKAVEKYVEAGRTREAQRARANQFLYDFIANRNLSHVDQILGALSGMEEIEELGSETEMIPAVELATEFEARRIEIQIPAAGDDHEKAQALHGSAAEMFQKIMKLRLRTYKYVPVGDHNETAEERYFLHRGHCSYHHALALQDADPMGAIEKLNESALAFKRAKDESLRTKVDSILSNLRLKRTCWLCHRELQGLGLNIDYYPASITHYGRDVVARLGQDVTTIDAEKNRIAVCLSCATMIRAQADVFALMRTGELRQELGSKVEALVNQMHNVMLRVDKLERR